MQKSSPRYFALVPAAGSGSRIGAEQPKQYLPLAGQPLIAHTLATLCSVAAIERVFVVLSPDDVEWPQHDWSFCEPRLQPLQCGGSTRAASVLAGLQAMAGEAEDDDWVLVHDAARPCVTVAQIERLIRELAEDEVGGLLAIPVADTLKRADPNGRVETSVSRELLWQAQTPQMFRYRLLRQALEEVGDTREVTDEASALEAVGLRPRLVQGDSSNLKVTWPLDLQLAESILASRGGVRDQGE